MTRALTAEAKSAKIRPEQRTGRIYWIDAARAIGIFAIVLDHIYVEYDLMNLVVNIFHVQLFFFLSGLCFRADKRFGSMLKNRIRRLLVPYFAMGLFSIAAYVLMNEGLSSIQGLAAGFIGQLPSLFYANSNLFAMSWNTPLWFLPCLFVCMLLLEGMVHIKKEWLRWASCLILVALGHILTFYRIFLPFQAETALCMLLWAYLGFAMRNILKKADRNLSRERKLILIFLFSLYGLWFGKATGPYSVRSGYYSNLPFFYLASVCLILAIVLLCQILPYSSWMQKTGKSTLFILLWQRFPVYFFNHTLGMTVRLLSSDNTWLKQGTAVLLSLLSIVFCLMLEKIWRWVKKKAGALRGLKIPDTA